MDDSGQDRYTDELGIRDDSSVPLKKKQGGAACERTERTSPLPDGVISLHKRGRYSNGNSGREKLPTGSNMDTLSRAKEESLALDDFQSEHTVLRIYATARQAGIFYSAVSYEPVQEVRSLHRDRSSGASSTSASTSTAFLA